MTQYIYLYEPRSYSPGYAFRSFDDALARFLKDFEVDSLDELSVELNKWDVWHEFDVGNESISVDDGGHIWKIELK